MGVLAYKSNIVRKDEKLIQFIAEHEKTLNKYPNLKPVLNQDIGNYYLKHAAYDVENLIQELSKLGLNKEMVIFNIKKYGYEVEIEYILNSLGFEYKSKSKIKVSKHIRKQAELFNFLFNVNRECYIRLRNKLTGEYRSYSIETLKEPYRLQAILKSHYFSSNIDMMYSINCYNNMYKATEGSLFSLQNIAIDVDFNQDEYTLNKALKCIKEEMGNSVPVATIIETGHRIRLLYTIQDVPATKSSIKLYKLVTDEIAGRLKRYGASAQAPTTFGRIEGSINSKNGAEVSNILFNPNVYTLRQLQSELLPPWERAIRKANKNGKVIKIRNTYTLNLDRLHDFETIQTIREEGYREVLCYLYRNYCLLSNMTYEEAWDKTLRFNNNFREPLKENTLDGDTKALNRKQYLHKSATILNLLDISHKEEEKLHLISIMSKYEYKRRNNEYNKNKYYEKLKGEGKQTEKDKISCRRAKIKDLLVEGLKQKDICSQLDISKDTYIRDRKYLKEHGLI
ncbi:hypothetical protein FDB40_17190 [Clostridium botulinum]|nr:hypothetical protein [Clostridium botulinum]